MLNSLYGLYLDPSFTSYVLLQSNISWNDDGFSSLIIDILFPFMFSDLLLLSVCIIYCFYYFFIYFIIKTLRKIYSFDDKIKDKRF